MKNKTIKSIDDLMYKFLKFDYKKAQASRAKLKSKKRPTSIALEEETIDELKGLAEQKGIPYQVLMRSFILEGLHKSKNIPHSS